MAAYQIPPGLLRSVRSCAGPIPTQRSAPMTDVSQATTTDQAVIHKLIYRLDAPPINLVQSFDVPATAQLVSIGWDTREEFGIALWYRFNKPHANYSGLIYTTTWNVVVRGTGDPFAADARHLATVVRDGFAWHLLDADGDQIRWAAR